MKWFKKCRFLPIMYVFCWLKNALVDTWPKREGISVFWSIFLEEKDYISCLLILTTLRGQQQITSKLTFIDVIDITF